MPDEQPNPEFTFIHFDQSHSGGHDGETRRKVRSGAARASHSSGERKPKASKKKGIAPKVQPSSSKRHTSSRAGTPNSSEASVNATPVVELNSFLADEYDGSEPVPNWLALVEERNQTQSLSKRRVSDASSTVIKAEPLTEEDEHKGAHSPQQLALTRQPNPTNPFDSWPVPMQPFYPRLLQYLWPFMLRGWSVMGFSPAEQSVALQWVQQLTMTDPAYFFKNMHSAAGDLFQRSLLSSKLYHWLQSQCIAAIQEAVADERRQRSPGVILAVGRIALSEITLGDRVVGQQIHRPAVVKMIELAGGIDALNLPSVVKKHLFWGERLMSRQTGVIMLQEAFSEEHSDDIAVLNAYMPFRSNVGARI